MAGPKYATTNLVSSATVTATGTATGYSLASVYNGRPSKVWRSDGTTAGQRVNVDLGASGSPTIGALVNHNLPAAGTYKIESGGTAPPSSGAWSGSTVEATLTYRAAAMYATLSGSARYWSLYLVDSDGAGGTFTTPPQIGEFWLATVTQLSRSFRWGYKRSQIANIIHHETPSGVVWQAKRAAVVRDFALSWSALDLTETTELSTLHSTTIGEALPTLIVPFPDVAAMAAEVYLVTVAPRLEITDAHTANKSVSLSMREMPYHLELS